MQRCFKHTERLNMLLTPVLPEKFKFGDCSFEHNICSKVQILAEDDLWQRCCLQQSKNVPMKQKLVSRKDIVGKSNSKVNIEYMLEPHLSGSFKSKRKSIKFNFFILSRRCQNHMNISNIPMRYFHSNKLIKRKNIAVLNNSKLRT